MCDIITSDLTEILTSAYFRKDSSQPRLIKQKKRPVRHQVHRLRCAQHVFHYFKSLLSLDKEKKKNNRQQKQPTQETVFNRHYPRNTVKTTKKKKRKQCKYRIFNMPHCSLGRVSFTESHLCY